MVCLIDVGRVNDLEQLGEARMSSVVIGSIKILNVASGSNVQIGDAITINLLSNTKNYTNATSPGDSNSSTTNNVIGNANVFDPDLINSATNVI